jgi:hypothetical protein
MTMLAFTIIGLPAHPLVVHGAVVGIPLAASGVLAYVARPAWRGRLWWPLVLTVAAAWVFAILAGSTGETLEHALKETSLIERHAELAEKLGLAVHIMGSSAAVMLLGDYFSQWLRREGTVWSVARLLRKVAPAIAAVAALAALVLVGMVGHAGAKATWHDSPAASSSMRHSGN